MAGDITSTVRKYRKLCPSLKVYVCYDPAAWDASKTAQAAGEVRVQVCINDVYGARIYEKKLRPKSDATVVGLVDRMCRKAFRDRVKGLKGELKKNREQASKVRGKVTEIRSRARDIREQIRNFSDVLE